MNKRSRPLKALLVAGGAGLLGLLAPRVASANWLTEVVIGGAYSIITYVVYVIGYFIATIATLVFAIETFILSFLIQINLDIVNSPIVQVGFSIVLAFANIIFVAAIIAMAVATIIRYNPYGARQLLFKIVIGAIGVNFSLVLAGTVMNFSDQISTFLINTSMSNEVAPGQDGTKLVPFADRLAGAFQPQKSFTVPADLPTVGVVAKAAGGIYASIFGVYVTAFTAVAMMIFLGVIDAAFLLRYVWLGMLCILLPSVWVAWIFPFSKSHVSWWINKFIKWTFFAPLTLFFLYLAMKVAEVLNSASYLNIDQALLSNNSLGQGVYKYIGQLAAPLLSTFLKALLINGTLWLGLMFASKFGIGVAGAGMKAIESMGKSVQRNTVDRVGRGAKNAGLRNLDRIRGAGKDSFGQSRLQRMGSRLSVLGSNNRIADTLTSVTGIKAAGRSLAAVGTVDKKRSEERAKEYEDQYKNMTVPDIQARHKRIMSGSLAPVNADEERMLIEQLAAKKSLDKLHDNKNTKELESLMKRAEKGGYAETILKNNPMMARYGTPGKVRTGKKVPNKKTGEMEDETRKMTKAEMIGAALKTVDKEGAKAIAANPDLFGSADFSEPTHEQIQAVKGLRNSVLNEWIQEGSNPETVERIMATLDHVQEAAENPEKRASSKIFKLIDYDKDSGKSDDSKGYNLTDADMLAFASKERTLMKNIQSSAYANAEEDEGEARSAPQKFVDKFDQLLQGQKNDAAKAGSGGADDNKPRTEKQKTIDRNKERGRQRRERMDHREKVTKARKDDEAGASANRPPNQRIPTPGRA